MTQMLQLFLTIYCYFVLDVLKDRFDYIWNSQCKLCVGVSLNIHSFYYILTVLFVCLFCFCVFCCVYVYIYSE